MVHPSFGRRDGLFEVTSPQAFEGLRMSKREVRRSDCTLATVDHNIPTSSRKNFKAGKILIQFDWNIREHKG